MASFVCPPIIVSPVDPSDPPLSFAECERLKEKIMNADDGEVIVVPFPIEIHVFVDGYWIPSDQLSSFQTPHGDAPKHEPGESTYDPQAQ